MIRVTKQAMIALLLLGWSHAIELALAKRAAPAQISPVSWQSEVISPVVTRDNRVFQVTLEARTKNAKKILWKTQLYSIQYNRDLEYDVQEVYLRSLKAENGTIIAEDERGNLYRVDAVNGKKKL